MKPEEIIAEQIQKVADNILEAYDGYSVEIKVTGPKGAPKKPETSSS